MEVTPSGTCAAGDPEATVWEASLRRDSVSRMGPSPLPRYDSDSRASACWASPFSARRWTSLQVELLHGGGNRIGDGCRGLACGSRRQRSRPSRCLAPPCGRVPRRAAGLVLRREDCIGFLTRQRTVHPDVLRMPYDKDEAAMSKREFIAQELERLPEQDLDRLMAFLRSLADAHAEAAIPAAAAESSLAKAWLTPEEDAAWASL